ncbi:MAG: APC family permease [Candidatus Thermoplasmatota archaeon]|nr:APC family permease [Candidatus Thermoplasmatota archaeon]
MGEVFARKASGLVREASLIDTFGIGFMNNTLGVGIWTMASWGLFISPQGNMMLGSILASLMCIFGIAIVWGFLGGSMPRSGGDYIANSRIIHPAVGIAMSMTNAGFVMTFWIATLAPFCADPGMTSLLGSIGASQEAIDWCASTTGIVVIGSLVNIWGFFIVIMGLKVYNWNQRVVMILAFFTLIVTGIILTASSHADFVAAYDAQADADGSFTYAETIEAVRDEGVGIADGAKPGMDLGATLALFPAIAWATAYGYQITFICGEVKRPQRNIVLGQVLAAIIPMVFLVWFSWGLVNVMHQDFLGAIAYIDNGDAETSEAVANFGLATGSNTYSMISLLTESKFAQFCIGSVFIFFNVLCMPISYIAFSRAAFAWGMDRLGPMWFTDVSPRWHSPVKNILVMLVMSEIGIFIYAYWAEAIDAVAIVALEAMSAWGVMAISGLLFPYVKRARTIWEASPYKFRLGPIYVLTVASVINLLFVGILIWYFFTVPELEAISTWGAAVYISIWIFGLLWYFLWIRHWKKQGIDLKLAWKELPPA